MVTTNIPISDGFEPVFDPYGEYIADVRVGTVEIEPQDEDHAGAARAPVEIRTAAGNVVRYGFFEWIEGAGRTLRELDTAWSTDGEEDQWRNTVVAGLGIDFDKRAASPPEIARAIYEYACRQVNAKL